MSYFYTCVCHVSTISIYLMFYQLCNLDTRLARNVKINNQTNKTKHCGIQNTIALKYS